MNDKATETNRHLFDDERRYTGPKIDVIIIYRKYKYEITIIEVSGPPNKVNQTHRNKICKNLKSMYKLIVSNMEVPAGVLTKSLNLFGIHFYLVVLTFVFFFFLNSYCEKRQIQH
jgi:hypothetical protein